MIKTLEELAAVELPTLGTYKFIVAKVSDGTNTKDVLVGSPKYGSHADIASAYKRNLPDGVQVGYPSGGGRIEVTDKTIYAYGYSIDYGKAPQELVQKLLEDYAKNKNLEVKVEMGTGY